MTTKLIIIGDVEVNKALYDAWLTTMPIEYITREEAEVIYHTGFPDTTILVHNDQVQQLPRQQGRTFQHSCYNLEQRMLKALPEHEPTKLEPHWVTRNNKQRKHR